MSTADTRAFVAIELPSELQQGLNQVITGLQKHTGKAIRWVAPDNIHLTLKFLGSVSSARLNPLMDAIRAEAQRHRVFEVTIAGIGAFPNQKRPRIVWAGVQAPARLAELQLELERETDRLGYPREERGFSPHLTLGRVAQYASPQDVKQIADAVNTAVVGEIGRVRVDSLHLFRSDLQPGGAIYTSLLCARLSP